MFTWALHTGDDELSRQTVQINWPYLVLQTFQRVEFGCRQSCCKSILCDFARCTYALVAASFKSGTTSTKVKFSWVPFTISFNPRRSLKSSYIVQALCSTLCSSWGTQLLILNFFVVVSISVLFRFSNLFNFTQVQIFTLFCICSNFSWTSPCEYVSWIDKENMVFRLKKLIILLIHPSHLPW